jgi:hypothetical protein
MPLLAQLQPLSESPDERRRTPRLILKLGAKVGSGSAAIVHDISRSGLLFETAAEVGADCIDVQLPAVPPTEARVVWSHGRFYGCEFEKPLPTGSVSAALLQGEPKQAAGAPLVAPAAASGPGEARSRVSSRIPVAVACTVLAAGAAALILTGHFVALAVIGAAAAAVLALLAVILWRTLDETVNIKM